MSERNAPLLSPAMRRVGLVVAGVVVLGLAVALWFIFTSSPGGSAAPSDGSSSSGAPSRGPVPGATPTTGSEVLPPTNEIDPNRIPPRTPSTPLVVPPLPESASKVGGLVDGYPREIVGPSPDSSVLDSSIATEGDRMQVTLTARTDVTPEEVARHFEAFWAALGLHGTSQGAGTTITLAYTGAYESMTLAFNTGTGTGTVYMIYSVFRTK